MHAVLNGFKISSIRKYRRSKSPKFFNLLCSIGTIPSKCRDVYIALEVSAPIDSSNPEKVPAKKADAPLEAIASPNFMPVNSVNVILPKKEPDIFVERIVIFSRLTLEIKLSSDVIMSC